MGIWTGLGWPRIETGGCTSCEFLLKGSEGYLGNTGNVLTSPDTFDMVWPTSRTATIINSLVFETSGVQTRLMPLTLKTKNNIRCFTIIN